MEFLRSFLSKFDHYEPGITALCGSAIVLLTCFNLLQIWIQGKKEEKFKQEISDLYKALVISNVLVLGDTPSQSAIDKFKKAYDGKTKIFK